MDIRYLHCWEPMIPRSDFTPEKGAEQLARIRACQAKVDAQYLRMTVIAVAAAIVGVLFIGTLLLLRSL